MKKIKSLKMESSKLQLSSKDLVSIKGGSGSWPPPGFGLPDDPDKPDIGDGDPPPEIGTNYSCAFAPCD